MMPVVFPVAAPSRVTNSWTSPRDGGTRMHMGVDMPGRRGDPIRSTTPGRVAYVWHVNGQPQGNAVAIRDPDGVYHFYMHLMNPPPLSWVSEDGGRGREVAAGDVIGAMGNTGTTRQGSSMGVHLHYHMARGLARTSPRINPTARLMLLHAALEQHQLGAAASRREDLVSSSAAPRRPAGPAPRGVFGVGDWMPPIDTLEHEHAPATAAELADDAPVRARRSRVAQRTLLTAAAATPATPAAPRGARLETREAIEQARLGYRAAVGMVERELEQMARGSMWEALFAVLPDDDEFPHEQMSLTREILVPAIRSTIALAKRNAREAEGGDSVKWLDAFDALLSAHRMVLSLVSPFDEVRARVARQNVSSISPMWAIIATGLDSVSLAQGVFEELAGGFDRLGAVVNEGFDDIVEAGAAAGAALGSAAGGLGLGIVLVGALWAMGKSKS